MDKSLNVLRDILRLEMELSDRKEITNDAMVHHELGYRKGLEVAISWIERLQDGAK